MPSNIIIYYYSKYSYKKRTNGTSYSAIQPSLITVESRLKARKAKKN